MTDYIKPSQVIHEFLEKEKIKIEVDENAPYIYRAKKSGAHEVATYGQGEWYQGGDEWCALCPYFGPGGADNLLKALRVWCEKNNCYLALEDTKDGIVKWLLISEDMVEVGGTPMEPPEMEPAILIEGKGKTDGEALRDLLENLMEEMK